MKNFFDYILMTSPGIFEEEKQDLKKTKPSFIKDDLVDNDCYTVFRKPLADSENPCIHDSLKLGVAVMEVINDIRSKYE